MNTYASGTGNSVCIACDTGKTSEIGSVSCGGCAAGRYAHGAGICDECNAGKFSAAGAELHHAQGKYSAVGAVSCTACPSGRYQSQTGQQAATCVPQAQPRARAQAAAPVPCRQIQRRQCCLVLHVRGRYIPGHDGSRSCLDCAAGKFSSDGASLATHARRAPTPLSRLPSAQTALKDPSPPQLGATPAPCAL